MKSLKIIFLVSLSMCFHIVSNSRTVHTFGDSTMCEYDSLKTEKRGWAMYLGDCLVNGWTCANHAVSGQDSRSGYKKSWERYKGKIEEGDYVIIQFGHNDENIYGIDCDELHSYYVNAGMTEEASSLSMRGTTPTTYRMYLRKLVEEALEIGARPVLMSPLSRCWFKGKVKLKRDSKHDLGDNFWVLTDDGIVKGNKVDQDDHSYDYAYQMKVVAEETGVPFVDMTTPTAELYESYGPVESQATFFVPDDHTHTNELGARTIARMCVDVMTSQGVMLDALVELPDEFSAPTIEGISLRYKVTSEEDKTCTVLGFDGSPEGTMQQLTIPGSVNGYSVMSVSNGAFMYNPQIVSLVLSEGITTLEDNAFSSDMTKTVTLPSTIQRLGLFSLFCWNLEDIYAYMEDPLDTFDFIFDEMGEEIGVKTKEPVNRIIDDGFRWMYDVHRRANLHIPKGTYGLYSQRRPWGYFHNVCEMGASDMFRESSRWEYPGLEMSAMEIGYGDKSYKECIETGGMNEIDGKNYVQLNIERLHYDADETTDGEDGIPTLNVREEYGKVYVRKDEYLNLLEDTQYGREMGDPEYIPYEESDGELILYDFNMKVGDKFPYVAGHDDVVVDEVEMVQTSDGYTRRKMTLSNGYKIIEGIGCINSPGSFLFYLNPSGQIYFSLLTSYIVASDQIFNQTYPETVNIKTLHSDDNGKDVPIYDLSGRRISVEPRQGIYIKDGRKYVK